MATHRHTKKHASKKASTKKHTSKTGEKLAWCMACGKKVPMVESKEVSMKGRGGTTRKRLAGKDAKGHKVSLIL